MSISSKTGLGARGTTTVVTNHGVKGSRTNGTTSHVVRAKVKTGGLSQGIGTGRRAGGTGTRKKMQGSSTGRQTAIEKQVSNIRSVLTNPRTTRAALAHALEDTIKSLLTADRRIKTLNTKLSGSGSGAVIGYG